VGLGILDFSKLSLTVVRSVYRSLVPGHSSPKWHLDWFSCFCRAHSRVLRRTDRPKDHGTLVTIRPSPWWRMRCGLKIKRKNIHNSYGQQTSSLETDCSQYFKYCLSDAGAPVASARWQCFIIWCEIICQIYEGSTFGEWFLHVF